MDRTNTQSINQSRRHRHRGQGVLRLGLGVKQWVVSYAGATLLPMTLYFEPCRTCEPRQRSKSHHITASHRPSPQGRNMLQVPYVTSRLPHPTYLTHPRPSPLPFLSQAQGTACDSWTQLRPNQNITNHLPHTDFASSHGREVCLLLPPGLTPPFTIYNSHGTPRTDGPLPCGAMKRYTTKREQG